MDKDVTLVNSYIEYEIEWRGSKYRVKDYYNSKNKSNSRFECYDEEGNTISDKALVSLLFEKCELHINKLGEKV